ncbi:hypothetical protein BDN67DRAFT_985899 [Paxillus ammoniavirescens]|nr:hypothetical protein BDN67DRAFT_985899 [Paxillus ammoniavirescens]
MTKCVNSLMGKQEVSHQQVMSYLIEGGDYYTNAAFKTVHLYDFVNMLNSYDRPESQEDEGEMEKSVTLTCHKGGVSVSNEVMDYMHWPLDPSFTALSLWEFVEHTQKT